MPGGPGRTPGAMRPGCDMATGPRRVERKPLRPGTQVAALAFVAQAACGLGGHRGDTAPPEARSAIAAVGIDIAAGPLLRTARSAGEVTCRWATLRSGRLAPAAAVFRGAAGLRFLQAQTLRILGRSRAALRSARRARAATLLTGATGSSGGPARALRVLCGVWAAERRVATATDLAVAACATLADAGAVHAGSLPVAPAARSATPVVPADAPRAVWGAPSRPPLSPSPAVSPGRVGPVRGMGLCGRCQ